MLFFCTSINDLASSNRRSAASRSDSALKSKTDFLKNLEQVTIIGVLVWGKKILAWKSTILWKRLYLCLSKQNQDLNHWWPWPGSDGGGDVSNTFIFWVENPILCIIRGEYFSGINIFQVWIFFRGEYLSKQNRDLNHDDPGLAPMVVAVCQRHSYSGSKPGGRVSRLIRISFPQNDRVKKDFEKMKRQMFEIRQGFHLKGNVSAFEMIWPKESIWSLLLVFTGDF